MRKGGIKVNAMTNAFSGVTDFVRMTAASVNDKKFLYHLKVEPRSNRFYELCFEKFTYPSCPTKIVLTMF
jgi:hypothetical protein